MLQVEVTLQQPETCSCFNVTSVVPPRHSHSPEPSQSRPTRCSHHPLAAYPVPPRPPARHHALPRYPATRLVRRNSSTACPLSCAIPSPQHAIAAAHLRRRQPAYVPSHPRPAALLSFRWSHSRHSSLTPHHEERDTQGPRPLARADQVVRLMVIYTYTDAPSLSFYTHSHPAGHVILPRRRGLR